VIGSPHYSLVVLDDQNRVAHIAQVFQGCDQAVVVGRVESD